MKGSTQRKL
ncbi:hypothetical protein CUMW_198070 [Citrus unshiu]|nr:hypothetical protein CUMW_198070 [Citrus unshiu]